MREDHINERSKPIIENKAKIEKVLEHTNI